jgi:hypothetical protein
MRTRLLGISEDRLLVVGKLDDGRRFCTLLNIGGLLRVLRDPAWWGQ